MAFRFIIHPASTELLRYQSIAKFTRILSSFRNPRRQLLAIVAIVLGLIWVSQAVAAVLLRDAANRENLIHWIPLGLLIYSVWHLVKTISRKSVEPFEWTPAENELVRAAPLTRTQVISYRLASIITSAVAKALCFSIVMIPDLKIWATGFVGMQLGLMFVDLIRVCLELFFHGLSKQWQAIGRISGLAAVFGLVIWALAICLVGSQAESELSSPAALAFFKRLITTILGLTSTQAGAYAIAPFRPFAEVILASQFTPGVFANLLGSIAIVGGMVLAVYRLDKWMLSRVQVKERLACSPSHQLRNHSAASRVVNQQSTGPFDETQTHQPVRVPLRMGGFGSLVWRQLLGAWHYRMTLAISLGVPTLLCCIPMLADHNPFVMLLNIVGGIVFYSFLLLPSALMLDFRRDINRIVVLKSLPIGALAMTLGQLATPVLICSAFQWTVLMIAASLGCVIPWQAFVAAVILLPINTLIFAIENYIFLLAPYRRNQEGLDVFLRTILTFTAKGVMFAAALAASLAWAFAAKALGTWISDSPATSATIFAVGIWLMTCTLAAGFTWGIVRLYERFDPSQDAPSTS